MGIVLQDTFLFAGTVMENIRYGRLNADDEEVIAAARLVNAHDFISRLPEGYQTELTERGSNLSQGQRQLISFARAVLADPPDYTILFVAFSGHNQGLVGSREWIKEYLLSYEGYPQAPPEGSPLSRLVGVFNLNLLPDTNVIFPIITGNFYLEGDGFNVWPVKAKAEYLTFVGEWLKDQTGKDYGFYPYGEVVASDLFYAQKSEEAPAIGGPIHNPWLDHEPFAYAGGQSYVSVSFSTGRATYPFYGSPTDRYDMIQPLVGNLKPQLELVYSWLHTYLHTDFLHSLEEGFRPLRLLRRVKQPPFCRRGSPKYDQNLFLYHRGTDKSGADYQASCNEAV